MAEANWYVVHTYSGYENKVKANIEKTIEIRRSGKQAGTAYRGRNETTRHQDGECKR